MNKPLTPSTYVRSLNVGIIRKLSDFIDPQEGWKKLAVAIKKPSGDDRYNQFHIRRFEALLQTGKSPTCELLFDWGTTNCTVGDLVDLLVQIELFAPATLLLPDAVPQTVSCVPPRETATVEQTHRPCCEKDSTPVMPVPRLEQSCGQPDSSSPAEKSLEFSDTDTRFHSFSFYELKSITNNFDERPVSLGGSRMGEGGFGVVYKGCVNNRTVAVKKLGAMVEISSEELKQQFDQEIKVMAKCQHENLVELLGFSSDSDDLCLVYAYMPNGSLLDRLSCLDGTPPLSWHMRCKIAQGAADGISFLHENHHIHRDIKSANILLDKDFTAKISDFGLARASAKFTQTVMTSRIVGTTAYMAPEALRGEITPKSDIYSFGVVLLELITGLAAVDENREPQLLCLCSNVRRKLVYPWFVTSWGVQTLDGSLAYTKAYLGLLVRPFSPSGGIKVTTVVRIGMKDRISLDIKDEIEDEEKTIEDYTDEKMDDADPASVEAMYAAASQCLHEKKNKRPDITKVQQLLQEMSAENE